ncbi:MULTISPECIES: Ger(x)C family spore germination protein [unclassified Geobacillus]|uniref:Germination protein, Ger(X)C family n=1 Tax=Geobacillus sp. (strain WCH70) TaxID=471223 RepID=C5D3G0_GEOSW|nr:MULTISPECIES: Ger(x)C family spore germination protein [unclassified Geobacillus]PDM41088.1 Ger(x)C family spore germination protein [Parageobacillus yumthangensis]RDV22083.1 Ger(x)C family spore germination protein [Parageobacillus toebii]TXK90887.1 Ger(x)C family spore germination protein [Parageobacillus sp. SY1]PUF89620.1 Ger(x)C family spore germination protein [Geobacillus sp. LYN3]TXK87072.1 Ger(x)C family spore germination protein [Geobacillus sp. AYS3]
MGILQRVAKIVFACVHLILLSGCWDRTEVNDLALIVGLGIDQTKNGEIRITVEIVVPKSIGGGGQMMGGGGAGGSETIIRSGTGVTVADAISNLQEKLPRRVFWGHTKVIVFGEKAAKAGIRQHLDFLSRNPEVRLRSNVLVSEGTAKSVLELVPPIEQSSSEVLRELSESQLLLRVTVKDVLQMLSGDAGAAALPMVKIKPPEEGKKELQPIAFIQRTAIFKKDKMIGDIDDQLTRGVLWLRNEIKEANITIKPKGEKGNITATLIRAHTELIPKYEKGKWKMIVKATAEDDIILNGTKLDLLNPKYTKMIEKELAKETNKRIRNTLKKVQKEMKADIFGFADTFHRKYPREWNRVKDRWEEIFPDVEVVVKTKVYVRRPGIDTAPQGLPEQEVKK